MICYGPTVLDLVEDLVDAYAEVFSAPPWNENEESIQRFQYRLCNDTERPGFRAALVQSGQGVDGFATGWITPESLPDTPTYARIMEQLGPQRVAELLVGALELDELAVRRHARPQGVGRSLLSELTSDAPLGRAWVVLARRAAAAVASYRRLGWHEVPSLPSSGSELMVFLAPRHPAVA
ncbi:N-acetyltransferase [Streptomyces sp. NBC_01304]|uniref:N-acetyltransferase n=1 Tax=Streptomyces sp. NBC_01304 TaxID=2903818 RepID=UPI002E12ACA8|nr:GNAT family N-acetyltransferase [Streptomyces sp. NBC_01304]